MWVWQSQAPAGTSKFTGVAGWEALAKPVRRCMVAPAAIAPIRTSRRVSMGFSFGGILSLASRFRHFPLNPNAAFGQVPDDGIRLRASPGEPDVAVRTQQIERRPQDPHPRELLGVVRIVGNQVGAQQLAEFGCFLRGRGLPDDDQVVAGVVKLLEQVFDRAVRLEPEPQPRKTIARARRAVGLARQHFRQRALPVGDAGLGDGAERQRLHALEPHRKGGNPGEDARAEQPRYPPVGYDQVERAVGGAQQPLSDRDALLFIRVEQGRIRMTLDDERELPRQVVRILQTGVHALPARRAVHVRRVTEQEATPVAELLRGPVMDAVGGEPAAFLEVQVGSRLPPYIGTQLLERDIVSPARKRTGAPYENLIFDRRSSGREDLSTSSDDGKNPNARPDFVNGYDRAFLQICQAVQLPFLLLATPRSGAPEERLHAPGRGTRPAPPLRCDPRR